MNRFERQRVAQNRERRRLGLRPKKIPARFESSRKVEELGCGKQETHSSSKSPKGKMILELGAFHEHHLQ
jgi:hypothetical protein